MPLRRDFRRSLCVPVPDSSRDRQRHYATAPRAFLGFTARQLADESRVRVSGVRTQYAPPLQTLAEPGVCKHAELLAASGTYARFWHERLRARGWQLRAPVPTCTSKGR